MKFFSLNKDSTYYNLESCLHHLHLQTTTTLQLNYRKLLHQTPPTIATGAITNYSTENRTKRLANISGFVPSVIFEFIPENQLTKRKSVLKTPGPDVDFYGNVTGAGDSIPIAMLDDPNKELSSTSYKKQKLPAAYEALKKSGFNFTSYEEH